MAPSGDFWRCLPHGVSPRPQRRFLLFLAACALGLFITQRSDTFTLASMPKVIAGPGAVQFSVQNIPATSIRPAGRGCARVGSSWSVFAYASLLVVSLHGMSATRNFRGLSTPCRRGVFRQRMGSFNLSLSSMAGQHFETLPSEDSNQVTPWAGAQTKAVATAIKGSTCSSFLLPVVDEVGRTPAQLLQSKVVPTVMEIHHTESNAAFCCTRPACHFVGHQRKSVRSARQRYHRTATRATRKQTGAKLMPRCRLCVLPVPYDPSRVRVQIQDVLMASSCTRSASGRDAKMTAAKSEISQVKTHYISGNGFASENH